jgi:hypothetical protein
MMQKENKEKADCNLINFGVWIKSLPHHGILALPLTASASGLQLLSGATCFANSGTIA